MNLQNQVCSWEQGLKLHDLGVTKNKSYFQWMECIISDDDGKAWALFRPNTGEYDWMAVTSIHPDVDGEEFETARECSAFTSAELGLMLPKEMVTWFDGRNWHCSDGYDNPFHMIGLTEADAKANELISRIEAKWTKVKDVNARIDATKTGRTSE